MENESERRQYAGDSVCVLKFVAPFWEWTPGNTSFQAGYDQRHKWQITKGVRMFGEVFVYFMLCCNLKEQDAASNRPAMQLEQIGKAGKRDWELDVSICRLPTTKNGKVDKSSIMDTIKKKQFEKIVRVRGLNILSEQQVIDLLNMQHIPYSKIDEPINLRNPPKVIWKVSWVDFCVGRNDEYMKAGIDVHVFYGKRLIVHNFQLSEDNGKIIGFRDFMNNDRLVTCIDMEVHSDGRYQIQGYWAGGFGIQHLTEKSNVGVHAAGRVEFDRPFRNRFGDFYWSWKVGVVRNNQQKLSSSD